MKASSAHLEGRLAHPHHEGNERGPVCASLLSMISIASQLMRRSLMSLLLVGCGAAPISKHSIRPDEIDEAPSSEREAMARWHDMLRERGVPSDVIDEKGLGIVSTLHIPQIKFHAGYPHFIPPLLCREPRELMNLSQKLGIRWWELTLESVITHINLAAHVEDQPGMNPTRFQNLVRIHLYMDQHTKHKGPYAFGLADSQATQFMLDILDLKPGLHLEDVICAARYLQRTGVAAFQARDVETTLKLLDKERARYEQEVFLGQGMTSSVISHNELLSNSRRRFGTPHFVKALKGITGLDPLEFQAPAPDTPDEVRAERFLLFKMAVIQHIIDAPPGHRFFFDGHGSDNAFWFSEGTNASASAGKMDNPYCLRVSDLAHAMHLRALKYTLLGRLNELQDDVYIAHKCRGGSYLSQVEALMRDSNYRPRLIASCETVVDPSPEEDQEHGGGFFSYSDFSEPNGNSLFRMILEPGSKDKGRITFGDLIRRDRNGEADTSMMLLVPNSASDKKKKDERTHYIQISSRSEAPQVQMANPAAIRQSERLQIVTEAA